MAFKLIAILVIFISVAALQSNAGPVRAYQARWEKHMNKYNLTFTNSTQEDEFYENYEKNVKYIQSWNSNSTNTFKLAENKFSHLSADYIKSRILLPKRYHNTTTVGASFNWFDFGGGGGGGGGGGFNGPPNPGGTTTTVKTSSTTKTSTTAKSSSSTTKSSTTVKATTAAGGSATTTTASSSSNVNWTSLFTGIKDQGYCGSCYAFAAAGAVEAAYAIKYGNTVSLSEEYIIDCTYQISGTSNYGCDGGLSDYSLSWVKNSHPLYSTADYPYLSARDTAAKPTGSCHSVSSTTMTPVSVSSYGTAGSATESTVAAYVKANGPVTAYIDASLTSFSYYSSGIYNDAKCTKNTDHAVLIVGYGTDSSNNDYWIIRNSWGTSWGINGYMLMARNKNGLCGIVTENYYAKVS